MALAVDVPAKAIEKLADSNNTNYLSLDRQLKGLGHVEETTGPSVTLPLENVTLADALSEVERRMIGEALRKHKGNISRAARELGLTRRGLLPKA